jgi:hypothetical protein
MSTLKMSWKTEGGRLECRWVEPQEFETSDADLTWLPRSEVSCGKGTLSYVTLARIVTLVTVYKVLGRGAQASSAEQRRSKRRSACQSLQRL